MTFKRPKIKGVQKCQDLNFFRYPISAAIFPSKHRRYFSKITRNLTILHTYPIFRSIVIVPTSDYPFHGSISTANISTLHISYSRTPSVRDIFAVIRGYFDSRQISPSRGFERNPPCVEDNCAPRGCKLAEAWRINRAGTETVAWWINLTPRIRFLH